MTLTEKFLEIENIHENNNNLQDQRRKLESLRTFNQNLIEKINNMVNLRNQFHVILHLNLIEEADYNDLILLKQNLMDRILELLNLENEEVILDFQTHTELNDSLTELMSSLKTKIINLWTLYAQQIQSALLPVKDLEIYKKVFQYHADQQEINDMIEQIIVSQNKIRISLRSCPASPVNYNSLMGQLEAIINVQNILLNYFPADVKDFLTSLFSPTGASINSFTNEVQQWFTQNNLTNTICIKARNQNE